MQNLPRIKQPLHFCIHVKIGILRRMNNKPIGILSGTFDPIHLGHTHLATTIYKLCDLQKVLLIPCHQSPLKKLPNASDKNRFNMIQLATKNLPYLNTDNHEITHPTVSYTIKTLEYLRKKNATTPLALIMGTDVFNRFDEWHKWQEILDWTHLIVVNRPHHENITNNKIIELLSQRQIFTPQELQKKIAGLIYRTNIEPLPISATKIRALIKQKKDASNLVGQEVWQYISKNKLYNN